MKEPSNMIELAKSSEPPTQVIRHQLNQKLLMLYKKELRFEDYFVEFKQIWNQLKQHETIYLECKCSQTQRLHKKWKKVHLFLLGLRDGVYGELKTQILCSSHPPSLKTIHKKGNTEVIMGLHHKRSDEESFVHVEIEGAGHDQGNFSRENKQAGAGAEGDDIATESSLFWERKKGDLKGTSRTCIELSIQASSFLPAEIHKNHTLSFAFAFSLCIAFASSVLSFALARKMQIRTKSRFTVVFFLKIVSIFSIASAHIVVLSSFLSSEDKKEVVPPEMIYSWVTVAGVSLWNVAYLIYVCVRAPAAGAHMRLGQLV